MGKLTLEETPTDGHVSCERALLVDVSTFDRLLRGPNPQPDVLVVTVPDCTPSPRLEDALGTQEHVVLLLEGTLSLYHPRIGSRMEGWRDGWMSELQRGKE